jgi:hypothetical protein
MPRDDIGRSGGASVVAHVRPRFRRPKLKMCAFQLSYNVIPSVLDRELENALARNGHVYPDFRNQAATSLPKADFSSYVNRLKSLCYRFLDGTQRPNARAVV